MPSQDTRLGRHLNPHGDPTVLRFWSKVLCDIPSGCWLWQGQRAWNRAGYGTLYVSRQYRTLEETSKGWIVEILRARTTVAHRYAYELLIGPIPDGKILCHTCDTPPCVRPDHLFLGSYQDNNLDMMTKGRHRFGPPPHYSGDEWHRVFANRPAIKGEQHGGAKLTEAQVREIRQRRANGETLKSLGEHYGVALSLIGKIAQRKNWKHVV